MPQIQRNLPFPLEPDQLSQPQMLSSASCSLVLPRSPSSWIPGMTQAFARSWLHSPGAAGDAAQGTPNPRQK